MGATFLLCLVYAYGAYNHVGDNQKNNSKEEILRKKDGQVVHYDDLGHQSHSNKNNSNKDNIEKQDSNKKDINKKYIVGEVWFVISPKDKFGFLKG